MKGAGEGRGEGEAQQHSIIINNHYIKSTIPSPPQEKDKQTAHFTTRGSVRGLCAQRGEENITFALKKGPTL